MDKKLTIEFIRKEFEKEGYTLLTSVYKNNTQKLDYICPKGHKGITTWNSWQHRSRCLECSGHKKKDINFIRQEFEKGGYQLLTTKYKNSNQRLEYICPKGHFGAIRWGSWQQGARCLECAGKKKKDIEFIRQEFEKEGYQLLTTEYKNNEQKLEYICPKGHFGTVRWGDWGGGHRCAECAGYKKKDINFIRKEFEKEDYQLLTTKYRDSQQKLRYICPRKHKGTITWGNWSQGHRCSVCANMISTPETEMFNFLLLYFPNIIHNDRNIISPFELDIVIPSKKIAIEYCGIYWHSELHGKDRNYHLNKLNKAKEQGYRLITIFEDEYLVHKEVVLDRLKNTLGISEGIKINARDCIIKEIDTKVAKEFCGMYHLQGYGNSKVKLGAYLNDKLLSVITFSKPSVAKGTKSSNDSTYELNRFCSMTGYNIRGIASKLLSYFNRNYSPTSIISYADKRWSDGNLYYKLGFTHVYDSKPNYWYIKQVKRLHRFNFRKNVLKDKLEKFDPNISEWNNMVNNGYDRIWDCGSMKFVT